jgi:hypothetical protein
VKESRISENPAESRMLSEKAPPSTHVGDSDSSDDDSIEYIEDTTPGPGQNIYKTKKMDYMYLNQVQKERELNKLMKIQLLVLIKSFITILPLEL